MTDTLKPGTPGNTPVSSVFCAGHTPGDWTTERGDIFAGDYRIAQVFSGATETQAESDANARLMAAAPDLLAAVLALLALMAAMLGGEHALQAEAMRKAAVVLALIGDAA